MKSPFHCIAIDMGAATIRVLLGTIENSRIQYEEVYRFKNEIKFIDGHDRWDVDFILEHIITGINIAIEKSNNSVESLGIDSWGVDFTMLDEKGNLLETPVAYRDSRTSGMEEKWQTLMSKKETFERTGINFYIFNSLFQLFSIKNSDILKQASKIVFMPNYIYYKLTRQIANELTISSTSQLLDAGSTGWEEKVLMSCGVDSKQLGTVVMPGNILGQVNHQAVNSSQIKAVNVCSHDTASAIAAIPAEKSGFAFISTGTWCIMGVESQTPVLTEFALNKGFTNERGYGNTYRVLKNILGLWLVQGLQKTLPEKFSFDEMEKLAFDEKYAGYLINPEDELFFNPESMYEAFKQFFTKTKQGIPGGPGFYIKCAYDSLCLSFKQCIDELDQMFASKIEVMHMIGGGCQSEYLCKTTAGFCNKKLVAGPVEGAGIGNIMVQGIAMGKIKNLTEGRKMVRNSFEIKEYYPGTNNEKIKELEKKFMELKNNN